MVTIEFGYHAAAELFTLSDDAGRKLRFDAKPIAGEYFGFCVVESASAGPDATQWDPAEYPDVLAEILADMQSRLARYRFADETPVMGCRPDADQDNEAGTSHCWFRLIPELPELPELWLLLHSNQDFAHFGRLVRQTTGNRVSSFFV